MEEWVKRGMMEGGVEEGWREGWRVGEGRGGGGRGGGGEGQGQRKELYLVPSADRSMPVPGAFDHSAEYSPTHCHWYNWYHLNISQNITVPHEGVNMKYRSILDHGF